MADTTSGSMVIGISGGEASLVGAGSDDGLREGAGFLARFDYFLDGPACASSSCFGLLDGLPGPKCRVFDVFSDLR